MNRLLFALAAVLAGCNPCAERCRVEATRYDECLFDWGMEWADLGADDKVDFRKQCVADEGQFDASLDPQTRQENHALCSDLVTDLRAADGCDEVWAALVTWSEEP